MKKFQQNKVAMKIALSFMLGSALFLSACGNGSDTGSDTEKRDSKYYDTLEKAKNKLDWCSKKLNISLDYKKVEELEKSSKPRGISSNEASNMLADQINGANFFGENGNKQILDMINYKNCINAAQAYVGIIFKANE